MGSDATSWTKQPPADDTASWWFSEDVGLWVNVVSGTMHTELDGPVAEKAPDQVPLPETLAPGEFLAPVGDGSLEPASRGWLDEHAEELSFEPATGWYVDADGRIVGVHPAVGAQAHGGATPDSGGEVWLYNPRTDEWVDGRGEPTELSGSVMLGDLPASVRESILADAGLASTGSTSVHDPGDVALADELRSAGEDPEAFGARLHYDPGSGQLTTYDPAAPPDDPPPPMGSSWWFSDDVGLWVNVESGTVHTELGGPVAEKAPEQVPLPDGLRPDEFLAPVDDGSLESAPRGWLDDHADRLSFEPATGWYVDADGRVVGVHPAVGAETYGGVAPDGSGEVWLYNPRTDEWVDGDGVRSEDGPALPEDEPAKGPVDEAPDDQLGEDDDLDFGTGADDKETLEQESTLDDDGSFDVRREVDDPVLDDGSSGDLIDDGQDSLVDEPELREAYDGELEDTREHSRVTAEGDEVLDG